MTKGRGNRSKEVDTVQLVGPAVNLNAVAQGRFFRAVVGGEALAVIRPHNVAKHRVVE